MQAKGTTKSELATIIGSSPAYITKIFKGNANFTIESMVKLTRALNGRINFHITQEDRVVRWFDIIDGGIANQPENDTWAHGSMQVGASRKRIVVHD